VGIRSKTLLIIAAVFIGLMAALYAATNFFMLRNFESFEKKRASEDMLRVNSALANEVDNFKRTLSDWSAWDETYGYIETRNPHYVEANIKRQTYEDLKLNLILIYNRAGDLVYGTVYDAKTKKLLPAPQEILGEFATANLTKQESKNSGRSGIAMILNRPMIISAQPILTTESRGPSRGAMIMGRWLEGAEITKLSSITHHPIAFRRLGDAPVPTDLRKILGKMKKGGGIALNIRDRYTIEGFSLVKDIKGKPVLVMNVPMRREIYNKGISGTRVFYAFFVMSGIISALMLVLMLQKFVLSRLMLLSNDISKIGKGRSLSARLSLSGGDELSKLADNVNAMLDDLESAQYEIGKQEALLEGEERYRALVEHSPDAVFIIQDGIIIFTNRTGIQLLGASFHEEIIGTKFASFLRADFRETFAGMAARILDGNDLPRMICSLLRFDSRAIHVEIAGTSFSYRGAQVIQIIAHDDTRRKEAESQLKFMAYHDPLTELPNRAMFNSMLGNAIMNHEGTDRKAAIMLLDLDRFKEINDTMGHKFGDEMLIAVADRLTEAAGDQCVVARYSGDEFLLLFEELRSQDEAEAVAASLVAAIARPFIKHDHRHYLTASIGISIFPDDGGNAESLIMNADIAMYRAKARGCNNYLFYSEEIRSFVFEKKTLESELRKALESGDGLSLHYQPLIDLMDGKIKGVEALARWNHPKLGQIPPQKFIPVAEETGLIFQFGEWALNSACADNMRWQKNGMVPIRIAVNLSPRQFQHENLLDMISNALEVSGMKPECLELEITEGAAMLNVENAIRTLQNINSLGVTFSIDDFGTGYSSLSYLRQFPLSSLKIDASFIRDIFTGTDTAAIIKAIIAMTHSMNMKVTAEAVETPEQLDFLRGNFCDVAQGFFLHKPMPANEFERLILASYGDTASIS
jgi:diguanylate cyclase (GGDEF)-like protein/PAS domain S-box-containing protein